MVKKLEIQLIPMSLWDMTLCNDKQTWAGVEEAVNRNETKCHICGSTKELRPEEFFEYDDEKHVQKLVGVHNVCFMCYMVMHRGYANTPEGEIELRRRGLTVSELTAHYCAVNGLTIADFAEDYQKAFNLWDKRSDSEWTQDLGDFKV